MGICYVFAVVLYVIGRYESGILSLSLYLKTFNYSFTCSHRGRFLSKMSHVFGSHVFPLTSFPVAH